MDKIVKTAKGRFKILKEEIVWDFTKQQLEDKISQLEEDVSTYKKMLADIVEEKVQLEQTGEEEIVK